MRRVALLVPLALLLTGCGTGKSPQLVPGGNADRGKRLIEDSGCANCHMIPGIPRATARVGPPLDDFPDHRYIAGEIPNSPSNATRWIQNPKKIEPGTIMPNLGLTQAQARDIVAYLYSRT
jgi:cytochrome c2